MTTDTRAQVGRRLSDEAGLSMLEVVMSVTLVVIVLLASVGLVTRTVAQVGYGRTEHAAHEERAARAKTVASQWLQAQVEYMRSLGFRMLLDIFLDPNSPTRWEPPDTAYQTDGIVVFRDITQTSGRARGETPLPRDFDRGRVTIMVESVEPAGCTTSCLVSVLRVQVELFRGSGDSVPFVMSATSVQRP